MKTTVTERRFDRSQRQRNGLLKLESKKSDKDHHLQAIKSAIAGTRLLAAKSEQDHFRERRNQRINVIIVDWA